MKINSSLQTLTLFIIFFVGCSNAENEKITYNVSGTDNFEIRDEWHPISKSESRNNIKGTFLFENLEEQKKRIQLTWTDSITTSRMIGNKEVVIRKKIISTILKPDTFYLATNTNRNYSYIYNSHSESQVLSISQWKDSIIYQIYGTYSDTIRVECKKATTARNAALLAIDGQLLDKISTEIKNIASR